MENKLYKLISKGDLIEKGDIAWQITLEGSKILFKGWILIPEEGFGTKNSGTVPILREVK
jgi:hypothetical protein